MSPFFAQRWLPLLGLLILASCSQKAEAPKIASPGMVVTTAQAETRDIKLVEKTMGEVDSPSSPQVSAEISGRITEVNFNLGDPVKAGQVMAKLDPTDLGSNRCRYTTSGSLGRQPEKSGGTQPRAISTKFHFATARGRAGITALSIGATIA
jgi:PBP1b-binding outer membrane lipoprotein LpoB